MSDDRRKASGEWCTAHNGGEARGRDKGKGERLRTVGGDIGGGGRERREQERKRRRHNEAKRFGVA